MPRPPTAKQIWLEYEANVRCPPVNGRRIGITAERIALEAQWQQLNAQQKIDCTTAFTRAQQLRVQRLATRPDALAARQEANITWNAVNSNADTVYFFRVCRYGIDLYERWQWECQQEANNWMLLRQIYELVPVANRSAGQIMSINRAQLRENEADNERMNTVDGDLANLQNWLLTRNIYRIRGNRPVVLEEHFPQERLGRRDMTLVRNFAPDNLPAGQWQAIPGRQFGGAMVTQVWVLTDANNIITDRLVLKEQETPNMYSNNLYKGVLSWELEIGRLLTDAENTDGDLPSIVQLRDTNPNVLRRWVDHRHKLYKVYTHYCPYGDLWQVINAYSNLPIGADGESPQIPEPFVWSVAESLIRSGRRMFDVSATNNGDEIVHRDIKAPNVFLDAPNINNYPFYPEVRLGDFGQGFLTSPNDERNPDWWSGRGTEGWKPPEMLRYVDDMTGSRTDQRKLLEWTNVWQAGAVLRSMVTGIQNPRQELFLNARNAYRVSTGRNAAAMRYSLDLLRMIDWMMNFDEVRRPTFADLDLHIANLNLTVGDFSQGMRDGTAGFAVSWAQQLHPNARTHGPYWLGLTPPDPLLPLP